MRSRSFAWQLSALIDNERQGRLATLLYDTLGEKGDFIGLQFFLKRKYKFTKVHSEKRVFIY